MTAGLWHEFHSWARDERRYAPATIETYFSLLRRIERMSAKPFLTNLGAQLETSDVRRILREMVSEPYQTRRNLLSAAKCWHRWGSIEGYWERNGLMDLQVPSEPDEPLPPLSMDEARSLLQMCQSPREFRVVYLGLYAATRISEAERMDRANFAEPGRLHFRKSKTKRMIKLPVHPQLAQVHDRILEVPVKAESLCHTVQGLRLRCGFYWTSNALRRTFSTRLLEAGEPLWLVEGLMGHAQQSMTLKEYSAIPWAMKVRAISRLDYLR